MNEYVVFIGIFCFFAGLLIAYLMQSKIASRKIKEAEAEITTPNGKQLEARLDPKQRVAFIASANKEIHAKILTLLRS